jgi:hypothetical protein
MQIMKILLVLICYMNYLSYIYMLFWYWILAYETRFEAKHVIASTPPSSAFHWNSGGNRFLSALASFKGLTLVWIICLAVWGWKRVVWRKGSLCQEKQNNRTEL